MWRPKAALELTNLFKMKKILYSFFALTLAGCAAPSGDDDLVRQVDDICSRLTVEDKVAQLFGVYPSEFIVDGKVSLEILREKYPNGFGHVCQCTSSLDLDADDIIQVVKDIQDYLVNETPAGIPAIVHDEALEGVTARGATTYPQAIGLACSWNPELVREKTSYTAVKMRAVGQSLALSPMLDVIRTPHWSRIEESSGEDGYLVASLGVAFVDGLQERGFREGIAATTKHFLGYGGGNTLPMKEIYEEILLPHEAVIRKSGSTSLMTSYDKFRSEYAVCSDTLINHILRGYLGYKGMVVSDYSAVLQGGRSRDPEYLKKCAMEAINTGNDLEFPNNDSYKYLPELIADGSVSEETLDRAVKRALMAKARAGILDPDPVLYADGHVDLDPERDRQHAYKAATQSVVLLKNDGVLPLAGGLKIALVGPNANSYWSMLGDYSFQGMQQFFFRHEVDPSSLRIDTFLEALSAKYDGEVGYQRGCDWSTLADVKIMAGGDPRAAAMHVRTIPSPDPTDWDAAVRLGADSDVIIAAVGENIYLCGENRSRNGVRLPGDQEKFVKDLIATGKPVVLVVFGGRPQVIDAVADGCAAILQAWYPGEEGGNAVSDILLGAVNPSAKLSVSILRDEDEKQYCYNNCADQERVGFPFGFGLSYTSFEYSDISVQPAARTSDEWIEVSCKVSNTGGMEGTEIVELYASPASGQPLKPLQLKGFDRVALKPGETATVNFKVAVDQLAWFSDPGWTISGGDYVFRVGPSSAELPLEGVCHLKGKDVKKSLRDEYFSQASYSI